MKLIVSTLVLVGLLLGSSANGRAHDLFRDQPNVRTGETSETVAFLQAIAAAVAAEPGSCDSHLPAFDRFAGVVTAACVGDKLVIDTPTGLPPATSDGADAIMVGITSWIQRVPVPFHFHWELPAEPSMLSSPAPASPKGPIAVAVDGVPIFHYDRRPDANTDPERYESRNDTVVQGELDQCGGHAGQGDDYHYHYAPVCLVDPTQLGQPIGFGLDGIPIYFGTGGDSYYGRGRTSDLDNLPEAGLDRCNGSKQANGTYVYYTTATPPYVIGCHHARVDPASRIEPRPMRGQEQGSVSPLGSGELGEPVETRITGFYQDESGWYHLEFDALSGSGTSAVLYRESSDSKDCWDFDYRVNAGAPGVRRMACR